MPRIPAPISMVIFQNSQEWRPFAGPTMAQSKRNGSATWNATTSTPTSGQPVLSRYRTLNPVVVLVHSVWQTVMDLFSVKWEIWANQMKATPGNQTRSRVLTLFVMKKMIVDHSRVNTTFPINFWHGPNLNQLSEQQCSTSRECTRRPGPGTETWGYIAQDRLLNQYFSCAPYTHTNGKVFDMVPFPKDFATCTCNYNKPSNIRCKWSKIKNSIVRCVRSDYNKLNDGAFADEYFDEMYQYEE